ncbi:MAG: hydantoinase B/oxoprolinase family protein [Chloroflexi bacterium]|nr:hydantoinase B/oxoprolinase family protein [Chloroflexota bacterium]
MNRDADTSATAEGVEARPATGEGRLDPILFAVLSGRVKAIAEQMAVSVMYSARSPLLVEARDFAVGVYDADGLAIQQIAYMPQLGFAIGPSVRAIVEKFGDDVHEGDVFMHNDIFTGGNQLGDVKVARPVFLGGELIAWVAISAHQLDTGGPVASGFNPYASEIWQEALRITPVRIHHRGRLLKDVWDLIFANIRLPVVAKDIEAAIGGCVVGDRELVRIASKYGAPTIRAWMEDTLEMAERLVREEIRRMPQGVFHGSAEAVYDGIRAGSKMAVEVDIVVEEDRMILDFAGSAPQTPGYVNSPLTTTTASAMLALAMIFGDEVPRSDGVLRAVELRIPRGSFLNPEFPAASTYGNHLSQHIFSAIMQAFQKIRPEDASADWTPARTAVIVYKDPSSGLPKVCLPTYLHKGGAGALMGCDGHDHVGIIESGGVLATTDPEMVELQHPHLIRRFELNEDSCGHGRWRGGLGHSSEMELLWAPQFMSFYGDGEGEGTFASGILGGTDGKRNKLELEYPDGRAFEPLGKSIVRDIPAGTIYRQIRGGGGGCGDPRERDPELVVRDAVNGFISEETARAVYGVEDVPSVAEYHRRTKRPSG